MMPPIMANAIGPQNTWRAIGIMPRLAAAAVRMIGRRRWLVASTTAGQAASPCSRKVSICAIKMTELRTMMPLNAQKRHEAQRLAVEVERLGVRYAAMENKPQQLMERIAAARRAGGAALAGLPQNLAATALDSVNADKQRASEMAKQARAAMAQGDWITAERIARQAQSLVPDTAFSANEDRPALVLLDIERVKRGRQAVGAGNGVDAGVVQASATQTCAMKNWADDSQQRAPAVRLFISYPFPVRRDITNLEEL